MTAEAIAALEGRVAQLERLVEATAAVPAEGRLVASMLRYAASISGLPLADILVRRSARHAHVRFAVMHLASELGGYSLPRIGRALSVDHTTVMNGIGRARDLRRSDVAFRVFSDRLRATFERVLADPRHPGGSPVMTPRPEHESIAFLAAPRLGRHRPAGAGPNRYVVFASGFLLALLLMVTFA